jgi:hypothetical protein
VEIKLRLANQAAHARAAEALRPAFRETHQQENIFFDGAARELSARRCVMRCRFYNVDKRALLTVKARAPGRARPRARPQGGRRGAASCSARAQCGSVVPVCLRTDPATLLQLRQRGPARVSAHAQWGGAARTAAQRCCFHEAYHACNSVVDGGRSPGALPAAATDGRGARGRAGRSCGRASGGVPRRRRTWTRSRRGASSRSPPRCCSWTRRSCRRSAGAAGGAGSVELLGVAAGVGVKVGLPSQAQNNAVGM